MRALIYDDDDDLAEECAEAMRLRGYETRTRSEGREFGEELASFSPNIILLDVHMPEFNGIEALLALAGTERKADISVIMMSGARDGLLDAGVSLSEAHDIRLLGTLTKPFALQELDRLLACGSGRPSSSAR